jgi:hypothetical protein
LSYLDAAQLPEKTVPLLAVAKDDNSSGQQTATNSSDLIMRNPQYGMDIAGMLAKLPPLQQTYYATALSQVKSGWTPHYRMIILNGITKLSVTEEGIVLLDLLIRPRKAALKNVPANRLAYFNTYLR